MEQVKKLQKNEYTGKKTKSSPAAVHKPHIAGRSGTFLALKDYLQKKYGNYMVGRMVESIMLCRQAAAHILRTGWL